MKDVYKLTKSLNNVICFSSHYNYISHYKKRHSNVPLWVAMNALTFGQVSKIYQYAPNDIQTKICMEFGTLSEKQLHQLITVVARCRNVCAHGERLYSFHIRETIPDLSLHKKLQITEKNKQYTQGKQDLFSVIIALRYLIDKNEFKKFKTELTHLIRKVLKECPHLTEELLLKEMGFPTNWKKITRYRKL